MKNLYANPKVFGALDLNPDWRCVRDRRNKFHEKIHGSFAIVKAMSVSGYGEVTAREKGGRKDRLCIAALC